MARVTKINVGGTNYDIAHDGELKNSGFEVVTSLPTTGLFAGREVIYNGKKYVYSSGWKEEITANTMYEANLLWGGRNIANGFSPIDTGMMPELSSNVMAFAKPAGISIEYSRDGGVTWIDYEATDEQKVNVFTRSTELYCGKSQPDGLLATVGFQLRITITPDTCSLYTRLNKIIMRITTLSGLNCWCTFKGLKSKEVAAGNEDDIYYDTIVNKVIVNGWPSYNVINFNPIRTAYSIYSQNNDYYRLRLIFGYDNVHTNLYSGLCIFSLRFFGDGRFTLPSNLAKNNHLYSYDWKQNALFPAKVESKEVINFDVNNIEPTQTGSSITKTSTWLWQYLVQGVNWLRANNVRLSAYNTKVAALEQADSTKLDKRAYNHIYTNCGYVNVTGSSQGALIIELPFAPNNDSNNSMTYIELNVYSYKKGCSKYIIGVYSFSQNSQYEVSTYSYIGYNYFSKISSSRRADNNNIVIVLGDFTDVHRYEHFSISNIITGFNRNNDDTDGFLLYTDSNSNNYSSLKQSTNNPLIISYNDLKNTPNLAAVATSGSYEDLTNKPNLASVATSGNYDDLLNKPDLVFSNIGGTISSVQIPDGLIANAKLANSSMTLNGTTVNLGDTATLPCFISIWGTLFQVRIENNWLQIYRNGIWANKYYLLSSPPTACRYITDLSDPSWYDESVTEYELDNSATEQLLLADSSDNIANWIEAINANQITFNSSVIASKRFNKGALDNIISNLKGKGYSVFVENDIDTILSSGNDWVISIKIKRFNNLYKAIIECYVAR